MFHKVLATTTFAFSMAVVLGCGSDKQTSPNIPASQPATNPEGHSHEGDDVLFWQREGIEHEGFVIKLGHHGIHVYADHDVEPAASIMRDGQAVDDATVFFRLLVVSEDGSVGPGPEVKAVFEPSTDDEEAHYAQAKLAVPADPDSVSIQYRIEFAGDVPDFQQGVTVDAEKH